MAIWRSVVGLVILCFPSLTLVQDDQPLLLLIAYDGMRYDYLNAHKTPFLWNLTKTGVYAPNGIENQMWTMTMSNFYGIVTGLYEEEHGLIGNHFFDPVFRQFYDYFNLTRTPGVIKNSREAKWYSGEPIWQTNEKYANHLTGAMRWPACDAAINDKSMKLCVPFDNFYGLPEWKSEIDTIISWFTDKSHPINLALYYNPQPDHVQHAGDIYGHEVKHMIQKLDHLSEYLFQKIREAGLEKRMNVIFTSDHGFVNVHKKHDLIMIDDIIKFDDCIVSERSLFPRVDKGVTVEALYTKLKAASERTNKFDVYLKEDFPDHFHYKNNRRVGPIILLERLGYWLIPDIYPLTLDPPLMGMHGYSNEYPEMRPMFLAHGPAFKKNYQMKGKGNLIDLYDLMCHVLGIEPAPNNGSLDRIDEILLNHSKPSTGPNRAFRSDFSVFSIILAVILAFIFRHQ